MSRYPRAVRSARLKCIGCNAPIIQTTDDRYVCVNCGRSPIRSNDQLPERGSSLD